MASILDRFRATPWHVWLTIGLSLVGIALAVRYVRGLNGSSSASSSGAIVPTSGTDTPNYGALNQGESVQGNQILDAISNLSNVIAQMGFPQHTTPDPLSGGNLENNPDITGGNPTKPGTVRHYTVSAQDVAQRLGLGDIALWWSQDPHGTQINSGQIYAWNQSTLDAGATAHGVTPHGSDTPIYAGEVLTLPYRP